ncbi:hypothetical protein N8791_02530 [Gammaproteobacteria bacterium]|nr:hypothetical protein [Gammaproteobacteria bacterium]
MILKKILTTLSILAFIIFSSGINASPNSTVTYVGCGDGTNCGNQKSKNIGIGVVLIAGIVIYVVRNNSNNDSNLVSDNPFADGYGFTLVGKDRNSSDSNYRLNAFSTNNQINSFNRNFINNQDKETSINLIQLQF